MAAAEFTLTITRKHKSDLCTSGYLAVNGRIVAYALELPWKGNEPFISSIPVGTYGGILRYDKSDRWRIQLTGVQAREGIQIHVGNLPSPPDTTGCILIGLKLGANLCSLEESQPACDALRSAFYGTADPIASPDKIIRVIVEG